MVNPHALLLEQAPDGVLRSVLPRTDPEVRRELFSVFYPVGPRLAQSVVAHGPFELRMALTKARPTTPEVLLRLVEGGDARVVAGVLAYDRTPREVMLRVMPVLPIDELMRPVRDPSVRVGERQRHAAVLVEHDDPRIVLEAMAAMVASPMFSGVTPTVLHGYARLLSLLGPAQAVARAGWMLSRLREPSEPVRRAQAAPGDTDLVAQAVADESSTRAVIEHLRTHDSAGHPQQRLTAPRAPLDWEMIRAQHRHRPFPSPVLAALADQIGCPWEIRDARQRSAETGGWSPRDYRAARETLVLPAAEVVATVVPAYNALRTFRVGGLQRVDDAVRAVGELTVPTLGTDVDAWTIALTLLADFAGTLPELLDTARAAVT